MIYIEPNTSIDIIANAPIDLDGNHFLDFESETARDEFYNNRAVIRLSEYSYQRAGVNQIKVEKTVAQLYTCNYLRFKNINYQERYIYCFITNVEYINNKTSLITYAVDVLQTWFYNVSFNACFVEREHVNDDTIGKWRYPESIEHSQFQLEELLRPYDTQEFTRLEYDLNLQPTIIITASYNKEMQDSQSGFLNSLWNSLEYNAFPNGVGVGVFLLRAETEKQGKGITACYQIPKRFGISRDDTIVSDRWLSQGGVYISYKPITKSLLYLKTIPNYGKPKNNKLWCYPFTYIQVRGSDGKSGDYKIEDFDTDECLFRETLTICNTPESILTPMNYQSVAQNYNCSMLFDEYPQCSITTDSFNIWLATEGKRQKTQVENNTRATVAQLGASAIMGSITQQVPHVLPKSGATVVEEMHPYNGVSAQGLINSSVSFGNQLKAMQTEREIAETVPPQSTAGTGKALSYATETNGFTFYLIQPRGEMAKIIDDYFSVFGYAIHQVKIPNIKGRTNWNYVKTVNANISGAITAEAEQIIENYFNNGITIWHNIENFRNYNADNSIL